MIVRVLYGALRLVSRRILARHQPFVIAITGSVGKTSTKDALAVLLGAHFSVRASEKTYNNEIGVPCTVIGAPAPGRSLSRWILLFVRAAWSLVARRGAYPRYLILEFGADAPGDIRYLTGIVKPACAVITAIEKVHLEKFGSLEAIIREKLTLAEEMKSDGYCVCNIDSPPLDEFSKTTKRDCITYGVTNEHAEMRAMNVRIQGRGSNGIGLAATLTWKEEVHEVYYLGLVNTAHIYPILAACTVGVRMGLTLAACVKDLEAYRVPPGRGRLIEGRGGALLIDDTYNASPVSTKAVLSIFAASLPTVRKKIAVLGDMLELGDYSVSGHKEVGREFVAVGGDCLVTIGTHARSIADGARAAGVAADAIHSYSDQNEAIEYLKTAMSEGDLVVIKGSQGARMERVIKALMRDPREASGVLVRQDTRWLQKR